MQTRKERNLELAYAVLEWNKKHLNHHSTLTEELIGECFADSFIVEPNERKYNADLSNYKEFLNGVKNSMDFIRYDVLHAVADDESVVFSMHVEIGKSDQTIDKFCAMLLMKFNDSGKVTLWHEVYVQMH